MPSQNQILYGDKQHDRRLMTVGRMLDKKGKSGNEGPQQFGFWGNSNYLGFACSCCKFWTSAPTAAPTTAAPTTAAPTTAAPTTAAPTTAAPTTAVPTATDAPTTTDAPTASVGTTDAPTSV